VEEEAAGGEATTMGPTMPGTTRSRPGFTGRDAAAAPGVPRRMPPHTAAVAAAVAGADAAGAA
jgi:hypothetical protein